MRRIALYAAVMSVAVCFVGCGTAPQKDRVPDYTEVPPASPEAKAAVVPEKGKEAPPSVEVSDPAVAKPADAPAKAEGPGPLKVYILVGQSNMQGHAHVRTLDHIGMAPETAPMLKEMRNADGTPRVCEDVWISSIGCGGSDEEEKHGRLSVGYGAARRGPKIGPELTFGIYMRKAVKEPILIIKTAWGGKSLHTDFRPPSAGPYRLNEWQRQQYSKKGTDLEKWEADKAKATGRYYRLMVAHVKKVLGDIRRVYPGYDPERGYELAGLVWFQGWNDMGDSHTYPNRGAPGSYDKYTEVLAAFIRDVRRDLSAPEMPFVIGVMGNSGPVSQWPPEQKRYTSIHGEFRRAQARAAELPEFKGNVVAVLTERLFDMQLVELWSKNNRVKAFEGKLRRDKSLSREEQRARVEKYRLEVFTPEELEIYRVGTSNFEFHYLGSGKVMARIGRAFAEALAGMGR